MDPRLVALQTLPSHSGFTSVQFRTLDQIYCQAVADKVLKYRTVDCDFDEGVASYTYHVSAHQPPVLQFVIRRAGPRVTMFELYRAGKGRIAKSGLFERVVEQLREEIDALAAH